MGLALVPALATLWPRLRMPERKKYKESRELNTSSSSSSSVCHRTVEPLFDGDASAVSGVESTPYEAAQNPNDPPRPLLALKTMIPLQLDSKYAMSSKALEKVDGGEDNKANIDGIFVYFSEWRRLKTLIGTASCWFFLDAAFHGTNLNQSVLLADIGFSTGKTHWGALMKKAVGNLIIAVAGYVPGLFFTVPLIENMGRRWIQVQGFFMVALTFPILAGGYTKLGTAGKFVCFAIAQFFFDFVPNATTFIIPAEVFTLRFRGFAHGLSAYCISSVRL